MVRTHQSRVNQFSYRELFEEKVFPAMRQGLGRSGFKRVVCWLAARRAKPHQARMVMEWLDSNFGEQMPSSPSEGTLRHKLILSDL